jgi:hypothetical protein
MATNKKKRQTKLSSLSKDKALDDALRTRTHRKLKKTNVVADLLTRGRSSKAQANIKVEGSAAKTHMKDVTVRSGLLSRKERLARAKRLGGVAKTISQMKSSKSTKKTPQSKAHMYPPPKGQKSLFQKMKGAAEKIPGTESYKRKQRNKNVVTGVGRRPTRKDKD